MRKRIYVANWSTPEDLDAERDDSQFDCVADLAYPTGTVLLSRSRAAIKRLLDAAKADVIESAGGDQLDDEERATYERATWDTSGSWDMSKHHKSRRFFAQTWELVDHHAEHEDGSLLVVVVMKQAQVL